MNSISNRSTKVYLFLHKCLNETQYKKYIIEKEFLKLENKLAFVNYYWTETFKNLNIEDTNFLLNDIFKIYEMDEQIFSYFYSIDEYKQAKIENGEIKKDIAKLIEYTEEF